MIRVGSVHSGWAGANARQLLSNGHAPQNSGQPADLSSDWVSERDLLVGKFTVMEKFLRYSGQSCLEWNSSRLPSASPKKLRNSRSTSSKVFATRYNSALVP